MPLGEMMEPGQLTALRFLPFLAEATAILGTSWLLKRWMQPPANFGGRYWRSLVASIAALPIALAAIFAIGIAASLAYQSSGGQYENFSGAHLATFMAGTLGRAFIIWPFVIAWLIVKPQVPISTLANLSHPIQSQETALSEGPMNPNNSSSRSTTSSTHRLIVGSRKLPLFVASVALAIPLLAGLIAYITFLYPIQKAENTEIRNLTNSGFKPLEISIKYASGMTMPYFEVDCSKTKYKRGWRGKLEAARSLNYWARRAIAAEDTFVRFKEDYKPKAAAIAAKDAVKYWTTVWYLSDELECYDVASMNDKKPY